MKIGFVFPGQGSQTVGMGKDIYENYIEAKNMYKYVQDITKKDIAKISFEGPEEELNKTQNTQICILTMSLAILEVLKKHNIDAQISSGLSLGEYTALIYSNILNLEEGIKIVQKRGELMQNLVPKGNWSMAAIIGSDPNTVQEVCKNVKSGFVVPANYNCTGQIVISGEKEVVEEAMENLKTAGAKKAVILKTSGPFHTVKLSKAAEELGKELENIHIQKTQKTVIKNIDGMPYKETDNIKEILQKHIISPVQFEKTINQMLQMGVDTFVEIGPGKTLSGFIKRTNKEVKILNINDANTLEEAIKFLQK